MINELKRLETIFSSCVIVDVNFASWDKYVELVVVAENEESVYQYGRQPVLSCRFLKTKSICFNFDHFDDYLYENEIDKHYTWNVDDYDISKSGEYYEIEIREFKGHPIVKVSFERIEIRVLDNKKLNKLYPNWNQPFGGLIRPGIKE